MLAFFLADRVLVPPPTGRLAPEPRLRFLMTSVFRLRGRTTPWSLRKRPQALHSGWPSGFRRQSGVVWVKQLVQEVGALLPSGPPWPPPPPPAARRLDAEPCMEPAGGDDGRLWASVVTPDAPPAAPGGGEWGGDWPSRSKGLAPPLFLAGVD